MEPLVFDEVGAIVSGIAPSDLGDLRQQVRRYSIKLWFGPEKPTRAHYEAQLLGAGAAPGAKHLALEVGFHCEHPQEADNEKVLADLGAHEKKWRKVLGREPVSGPFLGRATHWRRVSELWNDPDLSDGQFPFEVAARLTDYITALEPYLRAR